MDQLPPDHPLFDVIEDAYRVFDYPKPRDTEACSHCMPPEVEAHFFDTPVRKLPLDYLQHWYSSAVATDGVSKAIWGYLLPRVLELLALEAEISPNGIEVALKRFTTGDPACWSRDEWKVLDRFQKSFLVFSATDGQSYLDDVLCMFARGGWPLASLLDQVRALPDEVLVERLWRDWCHQVVPGLESVWITAFWDKGENAVVHRFYTSEAIYERIAALATNDTADPNMADNAMAVASVIENERQP